MRKKNVFFVVFIYLPFAVSDGVSDGSVEGNEGVLGGLQRFPPQVSSDHGDVSEVRPLLKEAW